MNLRPDIDTYFLMVAKIVSFRSTCSRRKVGTVLVDENNVIRGTGYNGVPRGFPHCIEVPCAGAEFSSGKGLEECMAVHAEINAISFCNDPMAVRKVYSTASPCVHCAKILANLKIQEFHYLEEYPHEMARSFLDGANIRSVIHDPDFITVAVFDALHDWKGIS